MISSLLCSVPALLGILLCDRHPISISIVELASAAADSIAETVIFTASKYSLLDGEPFSFYCRFAEQSERKPCEIEWKTEDAISTKLNKACNSTNPNCVANCANGTLQLSCDAFTPALPAEYYCFCFPLVGGFKDNKIRMTIFRMLYFRLHLLTLCTIVTLGSRHSRGLNCLPTVWH